MPLTTARPVIAIGGRTSEALSSALLEFAASDDGRNPAQCVARFANWGAVDGTPGYLFFDQKELEFGVGCRAVLGRTPIFDGRIVSIDARFESGAAPTVGIRAEDRLMMLRATRRTRTFTGLTDADVVRRIAADHGLTARVTITGPANPTVAQLEQTDFDFLCDRVERHDAEMWVEGAVLHVRPHADRSRVTMALRQGVELRTFTVAADVAEQRTELRLSGWDEVTGVGLTGRADDRAVAGELDGRRSGAAVVSKHFGARPDAVVDLSLRSMAEAQAVAMARVKARARRFVIGQGVCESDPRLRVGVVVDLQGLGPFFSGRYRVVAVRHVFDQVQGLRTAFVVEAPGLGPSAS